MRSLPKARRLVLKACRPLHTRSGLALKAKRHPKPVRDRNLIEKADEEVEYLKKCGADLVIMGEQEIAQGKTD